MKYKFKARMNPQNYKVSKTIPQAVVMIGTAVVLVE